MGDVFASAVQEYGRMRNRGMEQNGMIDRQAFESQAAGSGGEERPQRKGLHSWRPNRRKFAAVRCGVNWDRLIGNSWSAYPWTTQQTWTGG